MKTAIVLLLLSLPMACGVDDSEQCDEHPPAEFVECAANHDFPDGFDTDQDRLFGICDPTSEGTLAKNSGVLAMCVCCEGEPCAWAFGGHYNE